MARIEYFSLPSDHDGLNLSIVTVLPDNGKPKALVQLAHGMSEHKGRYLPFMEFLAGHGFGCIMNDHRGHGESIKSPEDLGYFYEDGAKGVVDDLHQITLYFRKKFPGLKLFLFGHSMGSLAVRAYRINYDRDIDGLIVCGSPGKNPMTAAALLLHRMMVSRKGERYISPLFIKMSVGGYAKKFRDPNTNCAWLSTDRAVVNAYDADPLCGFPFTLNGYGALLSLMQMAYSKARAQNPELPVHFVSGKQDPCMPDIKGFADALRCIEIAGYKKVSCKLYPGMRHEILNETGKQEVYEDLLGVLNYWSN